MSFRPEITHFPAIVNGAMTGNITSAVTVVQKLSMMSYSYSWSGTSPVGTMSIQASNDYELYADGTVKNAGTWNTLTFSLAGSAVTSAPVTGNTGTGFIDFASLGAYAVRTVYTFTSGTGTLQAVFNAKVS